MYVCMLVCWLVCMVCSMCVCMYIGVVCFVVYVRMCEVFYMHAYTHTCIHTRGCEHTHMHTRTVMHASTDDLHARMHMWPATNIQIHTTRTHAYPPSTHMHVQIAYIHACTHSGIHTYMHKMICTMHMWTPIHACI